jgi:hypothetical protein
MKKFIAGLLMMPCMAHAEFFSGNDILAKLNGELIERVQALGFIQGVYDVYVSVTFCPPKGVTAGQVRDMTRDYLTNNAPSRHRTAESLINEALKQAWPCAQAQPRRGA